jgi:L-malate glycosyltransferase
MNILHVSAVKNWGGGEHHIENLCEELRLIDPNLNNTIFCVKNGAFHKRLINKSLNYITSNLSFKIDVRFSIKLGLICKQKNIDLIHIHDPIAIQLAVIADKIFKLPPFIFSKKTSFPIKTRKKTLYKYNYPKIKKILCVSEETLRITKEAIKDTKKLQTIYHGSNLKKLDSKAAFNLKDKLHIPHSATIVGNIANHIRAKDLDTLIDVADIIVNKNDLKNFYFIQIGTFTDRTQALKEKTKALGLDSNLIFLGYLENASNFIPQFNISLITSQSEGMPQFIYESMYLKTSVVSTNAGGISEIIKHNDNGFTTPIHDAKNLAKHIIELSNNKTLQERFISKSYNLVNKNFTTEIMAQKTLNIYKSIINDSQRL